MRISKTLSHFSHESEKVLIPFVLFVYGLSHPGVLLFAVVGAVCLYRYDRLLFGVSVFLFALHLLVRLSFLSLPDGTVHEGIIQEVDVGEYSISATVRTKDGLLRVKGFDEPPQAGRGIRFEGGVERPDKPLFEDGFDYGKYLKSQNIRGMVELKRYVYEGDARSLSAFREAVKNTFDERNGDAAFLMRTFILADKSALDDTFKDKAASLGVSHLFAVSGMHVAFMAGLLYLFFKKTVSVRAADIVVGAFLVFYIVLTGGPPSVLRAASMAVLLIAVSRFKLPFSAVDVLSLLCVALLIVRPYSLHDIGFVLSFLVSFTLLMGRDALQGRSKMHQAFNVSIMAFLVTVPIVFTMQNQVNLMSIVYNVLFVWVLMIVILPLVYLTALIPYLSPALLTVYGLFESAIILLHDHGMVLMVGHIPSGVLRVVYWALFAWMMAAYDHFPRRMFRLGLLSVFTLFILFSGLLNPTSRLTMFPVKGDAFLIEDAFSRCNILIDTGDKATSESLVSAMSRKHVRHLDYMIITHLHADHFGGYDSVASIFPVDTTITPMNVEAFENKTVQCGGIRFFIYPFEKKYESENDNSIVLWMDTGHARILFTGDMEKSRESSFLKAYGPFPRTDILKAGHHGSDTSSSDALLQAVDAKEVLVSAHPNNTFGHPGDAAIKRFESHGMTIHRTDLRGSVEFIDFLGRRYKKTALKD